MTGHADHGQHQSPMTDPMTERGPPSATYDPNATSAVGHESHGTCARPSDTTTGATYHYDGTTLSALIDNIAGTTRYLAQGTSGDLSPLPRSQVAANAGRFELSALGGSQYQTPAGLIYGPGSKHGHRLTHVLQHGFPDATKKTHSVFTSGSGALRTVDEAWAMRGSASATDPGKYVIPMGTTVGTGGETSVTIIVRPGTSQIITAFPSP